MTDIFDLVYLHFALNVQRVHLCTNETAISLMLEPFGEVGRILFIGIRFLKKWRGIKISRKNRSKNISAGV